MSDSKTIHSTLVEADVPKDPKTEAPGNKYIRVVIQVLDTPVNTNYTEYIMEAVRLLGPFEGRGVLKRESVFISDCFTGVPAPIKGTNPTKEQKPT